MTEDRLPLAELLAKAEDGDFLRSVAEAVVQLLMETDVEGMIGAGRHERTGKRTTYRNGYRDRMLDTRLGTLQLRIPKLRQERYFPPFLEPRKTSEKALVAVIQEAWISGVSTRRVDAHRRVAVSVAGRHLPQAARWRADRLRRRDNCGRREYRGQAGDSRAAYRPIRGRGVLGELSQEHGSPRSARREARHLRCARGAEGRDPQGCRRHLAAVPRGAVEKVAAV